MRNPGYEVPCNAFCVTQRHYTLSYLQQIIKFCVSGLGNLFTFLVLYEGELSITVHKILFLFLFSEHLLKKPLTVIDQFHSHLEPMKFLRQDSFHDQVSRRLWNGRNAHQMAAAARFKTEMPVNIS